ncbi:choline kinase [Trypanosoma theileri]|uniref:ethanolamine kinase n=1 Tax=Trypanosoma theileri TaxID=67003 RepID=A0A1X0P4H9_9TRYP|nr:choline kinase [Trypanosoma theileri]ORC91738.1 choline kinase [Trypanosoma theileri]
MTGRKVVLAQRVIPEEPELRRAALVEVVLQYCSHLIFPDKENRHNGNKEPHPQQQESHHVHVMNGNGHCTEERNGVRMDNLCVERLSGGITNELFRIYHPSYPLRSVVFRVFGKETDRVISRESELFYQSIFIPTYVRGTNFLIYKFLNQYQALPYREMSEEFRSIACELASFQVRATLESRSDHHRPLLTREERMYWDSVGPALGGSGSGNDSSSSVFDACRFDREANYTMHALTKWVEMMMSEAIVSKVSPEKREEYAMVAAQLLQQAPWMCALLQRLKPSLGESVCHNDLLSANIMRHTENGKLKIIDFDYVKRNYFLFDIANHFNEYTGLDCDYARYFPSDKMMERFIAVYRQAMREELHRHQSEAECRGLEDILPGQDRFFLCSTCTNGVEGKNANEAEIPKNIQKEEEEEEEENEEERNIIQHWVRLVKVLTLASHLSWSIWALLQEAVSTLDMNFLEYAKSRLARYLETKDAFSADFV